MKVDVVGVLAIESCCHIFVCIEPKLRTFNTNVMQETVQEKQILFQLS